MLHERGRDAEEQALVVRVRPRTERALGEHPGQPLGPLVRTRMRSSRALRSRRRTSSTTRTRSLQRLRHRKAAASSSSTGSTLAEADLRIAKNNIDDLHKQIAELVAVRDELHLQLHKSVDLGNQQLSTAARTANDMAHAHAKQLRTTKATTADAIAKMKAMRQHAHGFAELMLPHVADDNAPDHIACWAAFSGLLDDDAIKSADWAARRRRRRPALPRSTTSPSSTSSPALRR